jgi:hypothetical protein
MNDDILRMFANPPSAAHLSEGLLQEAEGQLSPVPVMNDDILRMFDREEGQG